MLHTRQKLIFHADNLACNETQPIKIKKDSKMSYLSGKEMISEAWENGYAIGAFTAHNLETIKQYC